MEPTLYRDELGARFEQHGSLPLADEERPDLPRSYRSHRRRDAYDFDTLRIQRRLDMSGAVSGVGARDRDRLRREARSQCEQESATQQAKHKILVLGSTPPLRGTNFSRLRKHPGPCQGP